MRLLVRIALRWCCVRRRLSILHISNQPQCILISCRTAASVIVEGLLCMRTRLGAAQQHLASCCRWRPLWRLP